MLDPLTLLTGAGIFIAGVVTGRIRRKSASPPKPICGCGHNLAEHNPETGTCAATIRVFDAPRRPCTCQQYVGPKPLEEMFAQQYLPPTD